MHYRTWTQALRAARNPVYYRTLLWAAGRFGEPLWVLNRYLGLAASGFPKTISVRHNGRPLQFTVYSPDDVVTAIECFAKLDYAAAEQASCVVDFGSNIGISLLYFLAEHPQCRVYAFEPDPRNVERLRGNLRGLEPRYQLDAAAIGTVAGRATFGREPTGRYGGLGLDLPDRIEVEVREVNETLNAILAREGRVDLLKIDVEGQERAILGALLPGTLAGIRSIAVEISGAPPELPGFVCTRQGAVATYRRPASAPARPAPEVPAGRAV